MKKQSDVILDRLKNVMASDSGRNIERLKIVLKSDIYEILSSYADTSLSMIEVNAQTASDGGFIVDIRAKCEHLYDIGKIID